jgi:tellurite resistance protein TerA
MTSLSKGANLVLPVEAHTGLRVEVAWSATAGLDLDVAAVAVDAAGRSAGPDRVLNHDRPKVAGGALELDNDGLGRSGSDRERLTVDLTALPADVARVLVVLSIYDADRREQSFAQLESARVELTAASGATVADFAVTERGPERAMVLGELYRHQDSWKFRAVGQGHAEGLAPIAAQVGIDPALLVSHKVSAPTEPPAPAVSPPPTAPATSAGPVPAAGPVILTKAQPTVSLAKQDVRGGNLRVNLNWTARPSGGGGLLRRMAGSGAIDLDLGCLYEFADGSKGVVQALGNAFSAAPQGDSRPLIVLDGDDRSGAAAGGETLNIDLDRASAIRRILVFALIYEGTPSWAEANAVVTWYPVGAPPVVVALDEHDPRSRMCAIAMLDNSAGQLDLRREVRYVQGTQRALDEAYGWGMQWRAGRK